jgi:hypothetical protein
MDWNLVALEGQTQYEERLRKAEIARRFLSTKRASTLPALLKSLLLIFF